MRRWVVLWSLAGGLLWGQVVSGSFEGVFGYVRVREWAEDWMGEEWLEKGMEGRVRVELGDEGGRGVVLVGVEGEADDEGVWDGGVLLYEGYVEQGVGEWGAVRVGRQVVPLGVCYGVHPVDGLHRWRGEDAVGVDGVGTRWAVGDRVWGSGFVGVREGDGVGGRLVWAGMVDGWVGDAAEVGVSVVWREDEVERPGGWVSVGIGEVVGAAEVAWEGVEGAWLGAGSVEWVRGEEWGTVSVVGEGVWQEEGVLGEYGEGWSVQGEVGMEVEEWGWVKGGAVWAAGDGSGMGWVEVGVRPGARGRVSGGVEDWVRVGWVWGGEDSWYGRHPEALRLECGMRIHF